MRARCIIRIHIHTTDRDRRRVINESRSCRAEPTLINGGTVGDVRGVRVERVTNADDRRGTRSVVRHHYGVIQRIVRSCRFRGISGNRTKIERGVNRYVSMILGQILSVI